ncbi:uncharacterized protein LOC100821704 [Brachypodium distachyon]|uniref:Uncharacterized protein n=1 Tax=Brachypodium distachyon TaxID=15368 RepID=A0A2K2DHG6_BRADI|nr:uncharacterized protein LOC100821704 [Brachypodium distachyon]PNT73704.1 hypothetical protein BRADI_2g62641v3 [Brachypodium distachyon]|eukprot:XP_014754283.1 uncharacterized protein LOC100821704 [Brachypodium distachyon]
MASSSSSSSEGGWVKLALLLAFFGLQAFIYALIAQDNKPLLGTGTMAGNGYVLCEFPRASVALGSVSILSLLLAIITGHAAVLYKPPSPLPVPRRALFRSTILLVFFLVAETVSASAVAMLVGATMADHDSLRYYYQLPKDGAISCPPTAPGGRFGGGALLALDATLMWFVCQLLALEARANYLDRLHQDDDDDDDHHHHDKKKKKTKKGDDAHAAPHQEASALP